jgi:inosine-uridine nucleoside N-ribohydrolase
MKLNVLRLDGWQFMKVGDKMLRKLIIDTDPGHDDAMAILLAGKHFDVIGITTVFGNQSIEKTTRNTLKILEFSGLTNIPVFKGCSRPIISEVSFSSAVHGEEGLHGYDFPEPELGVKDKHAVDFIVKAATENDGITLVPIGPLTNIALALTKEPTIATRIKEISLMGGSTTVGNVTPSAEFNIWADPEAADIVFRSGIPIKMVGLNLTRQAEAVPEIIEKMRALGNMTGIIASQLLDYYSQNLKKLFGVKGGSVHDACAVAWLIDPTLITYEQTHVAIELSGRLTRGMTVCDRRYVGTSGSRITGGEGVQSSQVINAEVGISLDANRFFDLLINTIGMYP